MMEKECPRNCHQLEQQWSLIRFINEKIGMVLKPPHPDRGRARKVEIRGGKWSHPVKEARNISKVRTRSSFPLSLDHEVCHPLTRGMQAREKEEIGLFDSMSPAKEGFQNFSRD